LRETNAFYTFARDYYFLAKTPRAPREKALLVFSLRLCERQTLFTPLRENIFFLAKTQRTARELKKARSIHLQRKEKKAMALPQRQILIIDGEEESRAYLSRIMRGAEFFARVSQDGEEALAMIRDDAPDLLLLDIDLPGMSGLEVLMRAKKVDRKLPVIMITGQGEIREAVEVIRAGACDYCARPIESKELIAMVLRALAARDIAGKVPDRDAPLPSLQHLMGSSIIINRLMADVERVGKSNFTVFILGETGTGKELVASAIHQSSARAHAPFIAVDCGAIPETLLESELYGYEKGAFTGAGSLKHGKFEQAHGGTLFLDEITNLPVSSQGKLMRVLQDKVVYRLGANTPTPVDVRLLVASNSNIEDTLTAGSFRRDLFYRLNEYSITIPPLRERKDDILHLCRRFINSTGRELKKTVQGFSTGATEAIMAYPWPGNVRQLRSVIRRAVLLADGLITEKHLALDDMQQDSVAAATALLSDPCEAGWSLREMVRGKSDALERNFLIEVLTKTGGNKARAARLLRIDYKTILSKLRAYGINPDRHEHQDIKQ
jgi:DNA-binding NtrC family response regulator